MKETILEYLKQDLRWEYFIEPKLRQDFNKYSRIIEEIEDIQEEYDIGEDGEFDFTDYGLEETLKKLVCKD